MEKPREFWIDDIEGRTCGPWNDDELNSLGWPNYKYVIHVREVMTDEQSEIDRLKAENARLREALIELSHSEVIKNDPESYEIVREALKGGE